MTSNESKMLTDMSVKIGIMHERSNDLRDRVEDLESDTKKNSIFRIVWSVVLGLIGFNNI